GDTLEFILRFAPTSSGIQVGTLTLQSNDPDTPESEVPLTGRGVEPKIVLSDATHEFGDVLVGQASDYWMLRITNEGEGDLFILDLQVVPKELKEFQFDANRFPSEQERTIAPGGALDLFLFFAPTSSGLREAKVIVQSDDPNTPELEIPLTGRGIAPRMALSESTHDFGNVLVGQSTDWTLRVTNEGDGDLILGYSMTSENGAFGFDPDRMPPTEPTLAPGDTLEFILRFAPTSSGIQVGTLTLQNNDPDTPESEIPLTGRGTEPRMALSESAHDFGNVLVGQVAYWTLRITNEGDGDLYLDPSVTPLTAGFGWDETQLPRDWRIVSPGKTLELVLGFAPGDTTLIGLQTATLTLKSNDPDAPEVVVTMKGACVKVPRPAIRILESHHDFGNVPVRQGAYWTLRITNAGNADLSIGYSISSEDGSFGWDPERMPSESPVVSPGDTLELFLLFAPISSGHQEGTVILPSNDPDAPELEVTLEGHGVLPGLLLSELEHDFGDVQVGQGAYWTLRIDNTGEADLSIGYSISSEEGSFGWDPERVPTEQTVSPGEPLELFLMFAPKSSGSKEGTLVIESSDPNNPKLEVTLQGRAIQPRMVLSESAYDFGDVQMGQGARWTLRLSNEGESDLSIGYAVTSGDGSFGWDPDRIPTEQTVSPGDTLEFFLLFVPAALGPHSGALTIQSNDPDQPEVVVNMTGAGVEAPRPDIRISASEHDFGDVEVGQAAYWTLRIFNEGKADLFLGYVLTSEYGSYGWDPQRQPPTEPTISPGDTLEFVVGFAPNDTTLQTGTLILETNDPDEPGVEIPLRGTGVAPPPSPPPAQPQIVVQESYDFGNVAVGQTADWTLRITNGGAADLSIIGLLLTPEEAEFAFDDTRLPPKWTLALGDTMELFLFFAPSSSGLQEGTVIIQSTDPDRPEVQVTLSGIGAVQDIALEASQHDFGEVAIEQEEQWDLVILNEGTMPLSVETVWLKTGSVFSLEALTLPQTIEPEGTLNVTVGFTPISAGTFRDVLVVTSDDPDEKTSEVDLVGTGKQQVVQRMDCPEVTRAKTYGMISIPLTMTNGSAEWVLGPVLGAYDKALWRLFRYQNEKYVEYGGGIAPFSPGRGFWLITRENVRLYAGPGRSAIANTPEGDFKITLQPGWNMIGAPFDFPVAWSQVDLGGKNVEPPVAFDGMAFRYNQTTLEPWQGYAVKNLEPTAVDLRIPPIRAGKSSPSKGMGTRQPAASPGGWTMNMKVRCGGAEDVENTLGWL
ncbi:MAG: choice-of-anchor D domain-containing protein, partial [Candidatus Latescibacteria bacterium]|nr:choice-of-anchor D domain-containing protein [Candidatus Latescibacterota bacterium]